MFSYNITCNLKHTEIVDYSEFYNALQKLSTHCAYLNSVWIIRSNYSILQIKRYLAKYIHKNDQLFVSTLRSCSSFYNIKSYGKLRYRKWLSNNLELYL